MSVVVAQLGARMHYAVPRILERAQLLEVLYTDICARKGWPRLLNLMPTAMQPARVRRLMSRQPEGIPSRRIRAFNSFGMEYARRLARARSADERHVAFLWAGQEFCRHVVESGFGKAKAVYVFNSAGLELLGEAHRRGLKGVIEQTIAPRAMERALLAAESVRFSDWEAPMAEGPLVEEYCAREAAEWNAADLIICGSEFVRDGIVVCGGDREKCIVIPYGIEHESEAPIRSARRTGPLRVLTVGAVCLRKGAPYVLDAAKRMGGAAEFRMAGAIQILPGAEKQIRQHVDLAGIIPRSEMEAQYAWADVFLLPSLCEGSATATYEAMRHGLPVICTRETGSVVSDGEDGFIIPARDGEAIADKLAMLSRKPDLLAAMSEAARRNGAGCSLEKYGERLLVAFRSRGIIP